jgi:hypothetical protein
MCAVTLAASTCFCAAVASAASPVPIAFGTSWDAPGHDLQTILDAYTGAPGALDAHTSYIGATAGSLDPWFWVGNSIPAMLITEIAGNADLNTVGWYRETFGVPVIDGIDDGVVFTGGESGGASHLITFPAGTTKFGFYLDTHAVVSTPSGTHEQLFFTNRFLNDLGLNGAGATHVPFDGDAQAIVFDVSRWKGANTWLVCFEDTDSGAPVTACCSGTDNDFNDMVFEVTASGATPAHTLTFGQLKARAR